MNKKIKSKIAESKVTSTALSNSMRGESKKSLQKVPTVGTKTLANNSKNKLFDNLEFSIPGISLKKTK